MNDNDKIRTACVLYNAAVLSTEPFGDAILGKVIDARQVVEDVFNGKLDKTKILAVIASNGNLREAVK